MLIPIFFRLVIETLDPLAADRKCFRMVNGVLVERTVKDVLPTLKTNSDGLKQVLEDMLKQYKSKQGELDTWKVSTSPVSWLFLSPEPYPGNLIWAVLTLIPLCRRRTTSRSCSLSGIPFLCILSIYVFPGGAV